MIIEIRTYRLRPGSRAEFLRVMHDEVEPLLRGSGIEVVDVGGSLVDEDGHEEAYLVRRFASLEERERLEEAFYSGEAWRGGPRSAIVEPIESYHTIVLDVPDGDWPRPLSRS